MFKTFLSFFTTFVLLTALQVSGREPYRATVILSPQETSVNAPNLLDLTRDLRTATLELLLTGYTPVSPVAIDFNLRGLLAEGSFAAGSTDLVVVLPNTGTTETFSGGTREDSLKLFKEFIRDGGKNHSLLKAYAQYSPIDPIAGNPNSLMAVMAEASYQMGNLSPLSNCYDCMAQPLEHQVQTGVLVTRGYSHGFDTTSVTLPFRYSYSPDLARAFIIDLPITYNRNGGASSIFGSLGIGARIPLTARWSLTPELRSGSGGSLDLCTSGTFVSAGMTSVYNQPICDFAITLTNYAGYSTTTNLWLTGVNFNYNLHNWIFKNGLSITTCQGFTFCELPLNVSVFIVDSYFARENLYINHYDEVGFNLIATGINPHLCYDCLTLGFAYQFGQKNYKGYNFRVIYQF